MRFLVCAVVAVFGIGMFAVAALVWDRRRDLAARWARRGSSAAGGETGTSTGPDGQPADQETAGGVSDDASGGASVATASPAVAGTQNKNGNRFVPHAVAVAALFLGMAMLIGSCAGLLSF